MTNTQRIFMKNIKMLRESNGYKKSHIVTMFNMKNSYYRMIEEADDSQKVQPTLRFMTRLSALYNVPIYEFFKENINIHNCGTTENIELIFAKNLIIYRERKDWTTYRFAKEIGISNQYLYRLENGSARRLNFEFLERLANLLDIEVYQLFVPAQDN